LNRHNLLLWKIVWRYKYFIENCKVDEQDLYSEARIGFIVAYDKFDIEKDVKFTTYAYYWILQGVKRYIEKNVNLIKIPVHILDTLKLIEKYDTLEECSIEENKSLIVLEKAVKNSDISVINIDSVSLDVADKKEPENIDFSLIFNELEPVKVGILSGLFGLHSEKISKKKLMSEFGLSRRDFDRLYNEAIDQCREIISRDL
jgi:RNA polymerase primary sigma factor